MGPIATARAAASSRSRSAFPRACSSSNTAEGLAKVTTPTLPRSIHCAALGDIQRCALGAICLDLRHFGTQLRKAFRQGGQGARTGRIEHTRAGIDLRGQSRDQRAGFRLVRNTSTCQPRWRNTCAVAFPTAATRSPGGRSGSRASTGRHRVAAREHDPVEVSSCAARLLSMPANSPGWWQLQATAERSGRARATRCSVGRSAASARVTTTGASVSVASAHGDSTSCRTPRCCSMM